jgi:hypothetical protein
MATNYRVLCYLYRSEYQDEIVLNLYILFLLYPRDMNCIVQVPDTLLPRTLDRLEIYLGWSIFVPHDIIFSQHLGNG